MVNSTLTFVLSIVAIVVSITNVAWNIVVWCHAHTRAKQTALVELSNAYAKEAQDALACIAMFKRQCMTDQVAYAYMADPTVSLGQMIESTYQALRQDFNGQNQQV